jgi:hypothetical protein
MTPVSAGTPLWLKVFGIAVLVAVVLVIVVMVVAGGHTPRTH